MSAVDTADWTPENADEPQWQTRDAGADTLPPLPSINESDVEKFVAWLSTVPTVEPKELPKHPWGVQCSAGCVCHCDLSTCACHYFTNLED